MNIISYRQIVSVALWPPLLHTVTGKSQIPVKAFCFLRVTILKHCGNYASYYKIFLCFAHSVCFVSCCLSGRSGVITLKALVFVMEMDLAHENCVRTALCRVCQSDRKFCKDCYVIYFIRCRLSCRQFYTWHKDKYSLTCGKDVTKAEVN